MRRLVVFGIVFVVLLLPALAGAVPAHAQGGYGHTVHVVQPGDTVYSIARYYGISPTALAHANHLVNPDYIYVGQSLSIPGSNMPPPSPGSPPGSGYHIVQPGDTLYSIAWRYGTTVSALVAANGLANPNYIYVGQRLGIPGYVPMPQPQPSCGYYYTVVPGNTLSGIAVTHGTTVHALARANGLMYPYIIYPGQRLFVPCPGGGKPHAKPPGRHKPPLKPAACPRSVQIVRPLEGATVQGVVQIIGTADIPNFQFYKLEYAMSHNPLNSAFASINQVYTGPASDTVLGTWYVGNMPGGPYTLRLTAVDNQGQYPRPCDVHIRIDP